MIKQLCLSLIVSNMAVNGMELVLQNHDLLFHITHQLCATHQWKLKTIRPQIVVLSKTNKILNKYYKKHSTHKNIVRDIACNSRTASDLSAAQYFGYKKIAQKIDYFFSKLLSPNNFTTDDLKQIWYLNCTAPTYTTYSKYGFHSRYTLLLTAIELFKFKTAHDLIIAGVNCYATKARKNPLAFMSYYREYISTEPREHWFNIIRLLLEKDIHPDSRFSKKSLTLLHIAARNKDKELAHLLLTYEADPYTTCHISNAFHMERGEPKGWLKTMVNEIKQIKESSSKK